VRIVVDEERFVSVLGKDLGLTLVNFFLI
jgi:hypothetical protein